MAPAATLGGSTGGSRGTSVGLAGAGLGVVTATARGGLGLGGFYVYERKRI